MSMDVIDDLSHDRNTLIDAIQAVIAEIQENEAGLDEGTPESQVKFAKLVIKHARQDLQKALNEVLGVQYQPQEPPFPLDDIPF